MDVHLEQPKLQLTNVAVRVTQLAQVFPAGATEPRGVWVVKLLFYKLSTLAKAANCRH